MEGQKERAKSRSSRRTFMRGGWLKSLLIDQPLAHALLANPE